ncbi:MAG TPA: hypothetical protein VFJ88_04660 [Chthoniobacterales bacterium]|jgi:hypothetical protein|nr:hypothetical protein [Chthoniobacterales bacterium]
MKSSLVFVAVLALTTWLVVASPSPSSSPSPACTDPEFHQFDFWLGEWTVKDPEGKGLGRSEISRVADGCAIREQWHDADGSEGMSLNYFDRNDRQWHQDWVGGKGGILHLQGTLKENAMILSGETRKGEKVTLHRVTWKALPNHTVEQKWESSADQAGNWKVVFLGYYWKRS